MSYRKPHKPNHHRNHASIDKRTPPKAAKHRRGSRRVARAHRDTWTGALHKEIAVGAARRKSRRTTGAAKRKARRAARHGAA